LGSCKKEKIIKKYRLFKMAKNFLIYLWIKVLFDPEEILRKEKEKASLCGAFLNFGLGGVLVCLIAFIFLLPKFPSNLIMLPVAIMIFPLLPAFVFLYSLILFLAARLIGGKGDYTPQTYLLSLFLPPIGILRLILVMGLTYLAILCKFIFGYPCDVSVLATILDLLISLYSFYLIFLTLKEVHNFTTLRTIAAILLHVVIFLALTSFFLSFLHPNFSLLITFHTFLLSIPIKIIKIPKSKL